MSLTNLDYITKKMHKTPNEIQLELSEEVRQEIMESFYENMTNIISELPLDATSEMHQNIIYNTGLNHFRDSKIWMDFMNKKTMSSPLHPDKWLRWALNLDNYQCTSWMKPFSSCSVNCDEKKTLVYKLNNNRTWDSLSVEIKQRRMTNAYNFLIGALGKISEKLNLKKRHIVYYNIIKNTGIDEYRNSLDWVTFMDQKTIGKNTIGDHWLRWAFGLDHPESWKLAFHYTIKTKKSSWEKIKHYFGVKDDVVH